MPVHAATVNRSVSNHTVNETRQWIAMPLDKATKEALMAYERIQGENQRDEQHIIYFHSKGVVSDKPLRRRPPSMPTAILVYICFMLTIICIGAIIFAVQAYAKWAN